MDKKLEGRLKLEIEHIFESGANEIRVLEMFKNFIQKHYHKEELKYKIRHKPTGLYYKDVTNTGNLSLAGKVFKNKPTIPRQVRVIFSISRKNEAQAIIRDFYNIQYGVFPDVTFKTKDIEWEIIKL